MNITVEQVLSIYPLSEGKLVAGQSGASRLVKSVKVMDTPDIADWFREGEMVFTTAYLMKDVPYDAISLLRKLNQCRSAGLGIKIGRFWDKVPEPILEEANRLDFPLIELPYECFFSDQMNGMFHIEMQYHTQILHSVLDKQMRLMQFALRPDRIDHFFQKLLGILGYPIAVVGSRGQVIFNATSFGASQLLHGWTWEKEAQWAFVEESRCFRVPLKEHDECIGYMVIFPENPHRVKVEEELFLQTAEIISYHMGVILNEYRNHAAQNDLGLLLSRYLRGSGTIEALTEEAARRGIPLFQGAYRGLLSIISPDTGYREKDSLLRNIREEMQYHPELKEMAVIHFSIQEGLFSVFLVDAPGADGKLNDLLRTCLRGVLQEDSGTPLRICVSNKKNRPDQLRDAYNECLETSRLADRLGIREAVVQFGAVELAYLFQHVPREHMQTYVNEVLEMLLKKDPEYSQEMLRTLEAFIENDGQVNETAKQMLIHRNTVAYRLEKVGELLEVDYKKINDLLRLKLAFTFRQMLKPM
ncbi:purine catabolism regulatory protein [Paenibacillus tianmuensis]|uniref:Purine catabolism regulatory protein n=1 Tax=Paenibacillus tianmuensis TaxID=624147 RepID=A0A1G4QBP3_9BACL|nr:PucR family transcriptional regulator [Paenibacillus tianmuensis]SCW41922.1 purine catabolism regulatory protein [Paenibacillus tianmuensis]